MIEGRLEENSFYEVLFIKPNGLVVYHHIANIAPNALHKTLEHDGLKRAIIQELILDNESQISYDLYPKTPGLAHIFKQSRIFSVTHNCQ